MYATNKVIIIIILVLSIPLIAAGELSFSLFFFFCVFLLSYSLILQPCYGLVILVISIRYLIYL